MDAIKIFFAQNFSNMIWLAVFILAILPISEGRIAFPFAINKVLLKQTAMSPFLALITCFFASIFLCLFLLCFFNLLCKAFSKFSFFQKIKNKIDKIIAKKSEKFVSTNKTYFLLGFFVFIPLPLTGVWTACLIASFLNLDYKKSFFAIVLGNLFSLIFIYLLSLIFKSYTLVLILICFAITFAVIFIKKIYLKHFKVNFLSDN